jgi:flagellar motility protein MotE (MotC chaperone)
MEDRKKGKLGTIFYIAILPLIFTMVFGIIIFNLMDIPVLKTILDFGNKIPVISSIVPDSKSVDAKKPAGSDEWEQKYTDSEQELEEKQKEIDELKKKLASNHNEVNEAQKKQAAQQDKEMQEKMAQVVGIYANISASKAAAMIQAMSLEEATYTISLMDQELQSNILGGMKDAKKASQITLILKELVLFPETDSVLLKAQINELAQKQEIPADILTETIAGMPPAQSAGIIQSLMGTNSQVAIDIMKKIATSNRSQILAEIAKTDPNLAAQITGNLN